MTSFRGLCQAAGFVGMIGCQNGPAPAAAADILAQSGYWQTVSDTAKDGTPMCGVRTTLSNGAELRLIVVDNTIHLVAFDPAWSLPKTGSADVAINVDHASYRGHAEVGGPRTLIIEGLTPDFLSRFIGGSKMEANFGGIRWSISLFGSSGATTAMAGCLSKTRRG